MSNQTEPLSAEETKPHIEELDRCIAVAKRNLGLTAEQQIHDAETARLQCEITLDKAVKANIFTYNQAFSMRAAIDLLVKYTVEHAVLVAENSKDEEIRSLQEQLDAQTRRTQVAEDVVCYLERNDFFDIHDLVFSQDDDDKLIGTDIQAIKHRREHEADTPTGDSK